jgi:hypothetical protein
MLKLKTKTEFTLPTKTGVVQSVIRLTIDSQFTDINNVIPNGYFYYPDENGVLMQRDTDFLTLWSDISSITTIEQGVSLADLEDIVRLKLESGNYYGTVSSDWIIDND